MNQYLKKRVDKAFDKIHQLKMSGNPWVKDSNAALRDLFSDLLSSEFHMDCEDVVCIYNLLDMMEGKETLAVRSQILGQLIYGNQRDHETDTDVEVINKLIIDSVNTSLENLDKKDFFSVIAGRDFFDYFAKKFDVLRPETIATVVKNSSLMSRNAGGESNNTNLLFGSSDPVFKGEYPCNHALMELSKRFLCESEHDVDFQGLLEIDNKFQSVELFICALTRIRETGASFSMHMADLLMVGSLVAEFCYLAGDEANQSKKPLLEEGIASLLSIAMGDSKSQLKPGLNAFRLPGTPLLWMPDDHVEQFHEDLSQILHTLTRVAKFVSVSQLIEDFKVEVLFHSAQASRYLATKSNYSNSSFIHEVATLCNDHLRSCPSLKRLDKESRVALISKINDSELKLLMLRDNKSVRGDILYEELGL